MANPEKFNMCACAERRAAIARAISAARRGQGAEARASVAFVATSAVNDAAQAARFALNAAKARLAR